MKHNAAYLLIIASLPPSGAAAEICPVIEVNDECSGSECETITFGPRGGLIAIPATIDGEPAGVDPAGEPTIDELLTRLWSTDREERLTAAMAAGDVLGQLVDPESLDPAGGARFANSLTGLFATRDDDWFLDRLATSLLEIDEDEALEGLFRALLEHPSPNVRWRAIQRYLEFEDPGAVPALERLWRAELPPWCRVDLMDALDEQGSTAFVADLAALASSADAEVAESALVHIGEQNPPGGLDALLRSVGHESARVRAAAMEALGNYPTSREALQAVLALSRDPDTEVQSAAVDALRAFETPETRSRLMEIVRDPRAPYGQRSSALEALYFSPDPAAQAIVQTLDGNTDQDEDPVLHYLEEAYLGQAREDLEPVFAARGAEAAVELVHPLLVQPVDGRRTTRCWRGPEWAGDPTAYPRLSRGRLAFVVDRFLHDDRAWVQLAFPDCWVPSEVLVDPTTPVGTAADPIRSDFQPADLVSASVEIDLFREDLLRGYPRALDEAGFLRSSDESDRLVAVAVEVNGKDPAQIARFFDVFEPGKTRFHLAAGEVLGRLGSSIPADSPLRARFTELSHRQMAVFR